MNIFVIALTIFAGFVGMYESTTILVVGMAIDYAVHLAHFYNHAKGIDGRRRPRSMASASRSSAARSPR